MKDLFDICGFRNIVPDETPFGLILLMDVTNLFDRYPPRTLLTPSITFSL